MSIEDREEIRRRVRQARALKRDIRENRRKKTGQEPCTCVCHHAVKGTMPPHVGQKCQCKQTRRFVA